MFYMENQSITQISSLFLNEVMALSVTKFSLLNADEGAYLVENRTPFNHHTLLYYRIQSDENKPFCYSSLLLPKSKVLKE